MMRTINVNCGSVKRSSLMKNKGQIKLQQMAFMLIAITLFFALAGLFAVSLKLVQIREKATSIEEQNAQLLVTKLSNSPEFSCGNVYPFGKTNCIDADKVMALREAGNIRSYANFWQVARIEIITVFPSMAIDKECTMGVYPDCNKIVVFSKNVRKMGSAKSNFVSLCRKEVSNGEVIDRCNVAKLQIKYEDKTQ